jgi:hypothetical protein
MAITKSTDAYIIYVVKLTEYKEDIFTTYDIFMTLFLNIFLEI